MGNNQNDFAVKGGCFNENVKASALFAFCVMFLLNLRNVRNINHMLLGAQDFEKYY